MGDPVRQRVNLLALISVKRLKIPKRVAEEVSDSFHRVTLKTKTLMMKGLVEEKIDGKMEDQIDNHEEKKKNGDQMEDKIDDHVRDHIRDVANPQVKKLSHHKKKQWN